MMKLNQSNEPLDNNIRPRIIETNIMDGISEQGNSEIIQESCTQPFLQGQQDTQRSLSQKNDGLIYPNSEILQGEINQLSSIEELSSKLNNYIDSYLQELRQPKQFLEQFSLQQSESFEEDSSEGLCQQIYSKFVSQLNLSVIQSYDQISSIDEQYKDYTPLSLSTPLLNQNAEIGSKKLFSDQIHLTCSIPLSQA